VVGILGRETILETWFGLLVMLIQCWSFVCQETLYTTRELASWVGVSKPMDLKNDMNGFELITWIGRGS
jgi:hypothetical protein